MTKSEFAKTLISMVDNFRFVGDSEIEIHESFMNMLDEIEPKDRERFAQWGYPNQQSTVEECWSVEKCINTIQIGMPQEEKDSILKLDTFTNRVFKLDKNFHVYVHGKKDMLDVDQDKKGKYLKLYFNEIK